MAEPGGKPERGRERQPQRPNELLFGPVENLAELVGAWEEAVQSNDRPTLATLMAHAPLMEAMLRTKGHGGHSLQLLVAGVESLRDGVRTPAFDRLSLPQQYTELIRNGGLASVGLVEMTSALYHLRRDQEMAPAALAVTQLDDEVAPPLVRAMAFNNLGSLYDRAGRVDEAREANRRGLALLDAQPAGRRTDSNHRWEELKLRHGLVVQRAKGKIFADMPGQLLEIAEARQLLGDTAHIGRTYLDVARLLRGLGKTEAAEHYFGIAIDTLAEHDYRSAAVSGTQELAQLRRTTGEPARASRLLRQGLALAEPLASLLPEQVTSMRQELETTLQLPARCLVRLTNDRFLVETVPTGETTRYSLLTVDQEKKKGGEGYVRRNLAALLNHLLYQANKEEARRAPIQLSQKQTGVHFREKWPAENTFGYAIDLPPLAGITAIDQALDDGPLDGYGAMSIEQIESELANFDPQSRRLIELELARRSGRAE